MPFPLHLPMVPVSLGEMMLGEGLKKRERKYYRHDAVRAQGGSTTWGEVTKVFVKYI